MDEKERYPRTYLYDYGALTSSVVLSSLLIAGNAYIVLAMPEFILVVSVYTSLTTWCVFEVLRIGIVAHVQKVKQFYREVRDEFRYRRY